MKPCLFGYPRSFDHPLDRYTNSLLRRHGKNTGNVIFYSNLDILHHSQDIARNISQIFHKNIIRVIPVCPVLCNDAVGLTRSTRITIQSGIFRFTRILHTRKSELSRWVFRPIPAIRGKNSKNASDAEYVVRTYSFWNTNFRKSDGDRYSTRICHHETFVCL